MIQLSVNLNKVALLRNARDLDLPSVTTMGRIALEAGAHGLTAHPRPDARHITSADVLALPAVLADFPEAEYNIEGNPFTGRFMDLVGETRPIQATLVPDTPGQRTSDHGWDVAADGDRLAPIIEQLQAWGVRVSLFMDPDPEQITRAAALGVERIELYTEPYARAFAAGAPEASLAQFADAAAHAQALGLGVNAGHDLNLHNLPLFATIPDLLEVSIGHALTADALVMGLGPAVQAYLAVLNNVPLAV